MKGNLGKYAACAAVLVFATGCMRTRFMRMDGLRASTESFGGCNLATVTKLDGTILPIARPAVNLAGPSDPNASIRGVQSSGLGATSVPFTQIDQVAFRCPDRTKTFLVGGGVATAALVALLLTSGDDGPGAYKMP